MADTVLTTALTVIAQNYSGDVVRQINRTAVLLKLLAPNFRQGEGANIAWAAEGDGQIAESFAEGADPVNFGSDTQTPAILPFARYWAPWHVTGTALVSAATSRTPVGNIQLWARQLMNAAEALAKLLETDLYTGAGGNQFVGLNQAIGSTTNTYAGINRSLAQNAFWRPTVIAAAGATLTFAQIRSDLSTIKIASGYKPNLAVVSSTTYNKISGLFDPLKKYDFDVRAVDTVATDKADFTMDGGVGALKFDGCYIVEDVFCPDNSIYYLNTRYIEMQYQPAELSLALWPSDDAKMVQLTDGFDTVPLGCVMELLAKTGDSQKAYLKCYPQMAITRPNSMGLRSGIG